MPDGYSTWFGDLLAFGPHPWQQTLGEDVVCRDRLLRIPTGFGKTAGVVLPWVYHRVVRRDLSWPTRLVFTLPMRVLVEQTASNVKNWLQDTELTDVGVEVLMGGEDTDLWARVPEQPTVLVGTQDMFLSRALNRGYGSGRARWPVDFGLLSQDTLWVLDEVQLMDVGLMTGTQLAMFRREESEARGVLRPSSTWWMSATLQPGWLESVESHARLPELKQNVLTIPESDRKGGLWNVRKKLQRREDIAAPPEIAELARESHEAGTLTLIVVNRVATAAAVYDALVAAFSVGKGKSQQLSEDAPELRLIHSRFRGAEKQRWAEEFLSKGAALPAHGRIVVATQVVEAGVDISAKTLISEIAPWTSLVQRFGRCARYVGEEGRMFVVGAPANDDKKCAPYRAVELLAAAEGVARLIAQEGDGAPSALERFEDELRSNDVGLLGRLYPFEPDVVLRRHVVDELFDTTPDLTGVDIDVSQYIRSGDERDVTLFWRSVEPTRGTGENRWPRQLDGKVPPPRRLELCSAPLGEVSKWLKRGAPAWVLDYQSKTWQRRVGYELIPGQQVLLAEEAGGYSTESGFDPSSKGTVSALALDTLPAGAIARYRSNSFEDDDSLSEAAHWKTVAFHGLEVAEVAAGLAEEVRLPPHVTNVLRLAGRWHDVGKTHEVFQQAIKVEARQQGGPLGARRDLAKAPGGAWARYERSGFRHELASTLALFELLRRCAPGHEALLGPHREILQLLSREPDDAEQEEAPLTSEERALGEELAQLSGDDFELVAWLVCSHHGKVRCTWTSTPKDQEARQGHIHGVGDKDRLPAFELMDGDGQRRTISGLALRVSELSALGLGARYGASWRERVERLLDRWGPFQLAFMEAIFRAADWRASGLSTEELIG